MLRLSSGDAGAGAELQFASPRDSARSFGASSLALDDGRFDSPRSARPTRSPPTAMRRRRAAAPVGVPLRAGTPRLGPRSTRSLGSAYDYGPDAPPSSRSARGAASARETVLESASAASSLESVRSLPRAPPLQSPDGLPRPSHFGPSHCSVGVPVGGAPRVYAAALHGERWAEKLFSLARHGRVESLAERVDAEGVPIDARDRHGNTLLIVAGQNGLKRVAKACLRRGADVNAQNVCPPPLPPPFLLPGAVLTPPAPDPSTAQGRYGGSLLLCLRVRGPRPVPHQQGARLHHPERGRRHLLRGTRSHPRRVTTPDVGPAPRLSLRPVGEGEGGGCIPAP